jgi:hypothetical protein
MRLSMVMIARNERDNVRPCFDTFWDHVNEVVLCDTGSRDGTIAEAKRYALERGEPEKLILGRFKWCDDFAAARNHAHSLATGDVHVWVDLDDRIRGAEHLRANAERLAGAHADWAVAAPYRLADDVLTTQWSRRMFRAPVHWLGRTWEGVYPQRDELPVTDDLVWPHQRRSHRSKRDLDIARAWAEEDCSLRPLKTLAAEGLCLRLPDVALEACATALSLPKLSTRDHGQLLAMCSHAHAIAGRLGEAEACARDAVELAPDDTHCAVAWIFLGERACRRRDWHAAATAAEQIRTARASEAWQKCQIGMQAARMLNRPAEFLRYADLALELLPTGDARSEILRSRKLAGRAAKAERMFTVPPHIHALAHAAGKPRVTRPQSAAQAFLDRGSSRRASNQ